MSNAACSLCHGPAELLGDACPACYREAIRRLAIAERRGQPCGLCQTLVWPRGRTQPRYCSPGCEQRAAWLRGRAARRRMVPRRLRPAPALACERCAHRVASAASETGWECALSRMLACKPHLPGATPYAPRPERMAR